MRVGVEDQVDCACSVHLLRKFLLHQYLCARLSNCDPTCLWTKKAPNGPGKLSERSMQQSSATHISNTDTSEPCIRGHRSSKCQHFDRLMMKVPKAGRPLAKCPHPKGSCSCQKLYAFMIRIPKGQSSHICFSREPRLIRFCRVYLSLSSCLPGACRTRRAHPIGQHHSHCCLTVALVRQNPEVLQETDQSSSREPSQGLGLDP